MGQLVSLIHGKMPRPNMLNTKLIALVGSLSPKLFIELDVKSAIWRWIRGFHAALYQEYLPDSTMRAIHVPAPSFTHIPHPVNCESSAFFLRAFWQ